MNGQTLAVSAHATNLTVSVLVALLAGSLCAAAGTFLLKLGATGNVGIISFINPRIISGLMLYGIGSILWIYGMSRAPLSVVYPFNALTFVIVIASAYLFLGERISLAGLCGSALVLAGIGCITWGNMP